jgi:hypothetical protein
MAVEDALERQKPWRLSLDLEPPDYELIRNFAHDRRMSHADVLRSLVKLLDDPAIAARVSATRTVR